MRPGETGTPQSTAAWDRRLVVGPTARPTGCATTRATTASISLRMPLLAARVCGMAALLLGDAYLGSEELYEFADLLRGC